MAHPLLNVPHSHQSFLKSMVDKLQLVESIDKEFLVPNFYNEERLHCLHSQFQHLTMRYLPQHKQPLSLLKNSFVLSYKGFFLLTYHREQIEYPQSMTYYHDKSRLQDEHLAQAPSNPSLKYERINPVATAFRGPSICRMFPRPATNP